MSRVADRSTRPTCGACDTATASTISHSFGPITLSSSSANTSCGNDKITSMVRMMKLSGAPRRYAADTPAAAQDPGQDVPAEEVRAEREMTARLSVRERLQGAGRRRGDPRPDDRHTDDQRDQRQPDRAAGGSRGGPQRGKPLGPAAPAPGFAGPPRNWLGRRPAGCDDGHRYLTILRRGVASTAMTSVRMFMHT